MSNTGTTTGTATGFAYTCSKCGAFVVNSAHDCTVPASPAGERMDEMLPCPFCGGKPVLFGDDSIRALLCRVSCTVCYANTGRYAETRVAAVENWNRRTPPVPEAPEGAGAVGRTLLCVHGHDICARCKVDARAVTPLPPSDAPRPCCLMQDGYADGECIEKGCQRPATPSQDAGRGEARYERKNARADAIDGVVLAIANALSEAHIGEELGAEGADGPVWSGEGRAKLLFQARDLIAPLTIEHDKWVIEFCEADRARQLGVAEIVRQLLAEDISERKAVEMLCAVLTPDPLRDAPDQAVDDIGVDDGATDGHAVSVNRSAPRLAEVEARTNQCDGCREGLPVTDGLHYRDGQPWIGCTASRYVAPSVEAANLAINAFEDAKSRTAFNLAYKFSAEQVAEDRRNEESCRAVPPAVPEAPGGPVVAWMTHGRLPHKHKERTHFTEISAIADLWRESGMLVIPLRGRLSTLEEASTDPPPHPVRPHTPGWNPVDPAVPEAETGDRP